ncbi:MAG: ferrous iron transporter B [Armatimonadetes bacterium]|nr:ferrous iron transporter B [Armatimonadota bacterium]
MSVAACHGPSRRPLSRTGVTIALAGNPNVGKSTIFNTLTGLQTLTTNYAGATVEVAAARTRADGQDLTLLDLPGTYGLSGSSEDQRAAWDVLLRVRPDVVVATVDATNLARNLYLVLQLLDLGLRVVVAVNLADAAAQAAAARLEARAGQPAAHLIARERHRLAGEIARKVTVTPGEFRGRQAWRIATRPISGFPLLLLVLGVIFTGLFWGGGLLAGLVDATWAAYASPVVRWAIISLFGQGVLARTILWGLDAGLNAVLSVGIPYVLTFYVLLALLEDTGYLNAAAVLLDRALGRCGLSGRAAIPLVAGAGCNVPAIIGLRVLRTERERLIAGTLITLVSCSARTAVIFGAVARFIGWPQALLLYALVSAVMLGAGWGLNRLIPGRTPDLLMEIFPFRVPTPRTVIRKTWVRVGEFVTVAVPIVLVGSVVLGGLYETGWIRLFARPVAPVVEGWLGLPAVAGLTLVFAVLRKELALQLLVALAITQFGAGADNLMSFMTGRQIFTYALVNTIYIPCVATIAVLGRALGWRRAVVISLGTITLAVALGGIVARALALF